MSLKVNELGGVFVAVITPMTKENSPLNNCIDYPVLFSHIDELISAGVDGIVACGTTAQSATLSIPEHIRLAELVAKHVQGRTKVIIGAGSNCTREAIEMCEGIERRIGPSTFLHVTGYYNNPPQEGLVEHFKTVADRISDESNMILYNVPGRTKSNITSDTAIKLSSNPKIIGIKEASGDLKQVERIIDATRNENFRVLSGECALTAMICEMGGYGVISAAANIAPKYFARIMERIRNRDFKNAHILQSEIEDITNFVFSAKNPIPLAHLFNTEVRLPLVKLPEVEERAKELLRKYTPELLGINYLRYKK